MRRTSMCNPLQAQLLRPFKDPLEQGGRISELSRVQAHAHKILQELLCLQQQRQLTSTKVFRTLRAATTQHSRQGAQLSCRQASVNCGTYDSCTMLEHKGKLCTAIRDYSGRLK